ncbi:MAG: ZIP family metal transporter [Candidatus Pacearchaeota archaeon]|jgi:zinc and cadmium transporter
MNLIWLYSLSSVLIISLISLIGVFTLKIKQEKLKTILIYLISFSAGALFGDAFIHLLPELIEEKGFTIISALSILFGILIFFILEKFVHWQHCHMPISSNHVHPFAYMNLVGDALHNFIDGLVIAASYLVSVPVGIATTSAVLLHEIPQEIGDFGVMLHGGLSRAKALTLNFLTALTAVLGVIIGLILNDFIENIQLFIIPIAIGGFIYIAGSDLIPELHKETDIKRSIIQIITFILGVLIMLSLLLLE